MRLLDYDQIFFRQRRELAEFFGFETRNKYELVGPGGDGVGFAAERRKGILDFLFRQQLGHWRPFEIEVFGADRSPQFTVRHPFRFFFQRLEVSGLAGERIGAIQQRFAILSKRFDVEDAAGRLLFTVRSPVWRLWSFPFETNGRERAVVAKRWSGMFSELFTDRDNFAIHFADRTLTEAERRLVVAAALFIDLIYFERKA